MPDWTAAAHLRLADWHPRSRLAARVSEVGGTAVPAIDVHNHLGRWLTPPGWIVPDVGALLAVMDGRNVATIVNLDGMWGDELRPTSTATTVRTPGGSSPSASSTGRCSREPDGDGAARRRRCATAPRRGARGLKVWKNLGLTVRDGAGASCCPTTPRGARPRARGRARPAGAHPHRRPDRVLRPARRAQRAARRAAGQPGLVVRRPRGAPDVRPAADGARGPRAGDARDHVHRRARGLRRRGPRPGRRLLDAAPNYTSTSAGGWPSSARQPRRTRRLVEAFPDRVLFGTDIYPLTDEALGTHFRFLETADEAFEYAPGEVVPPQGRWTVSGLHLSPVRARGRLPRERAARPRL